MFRFGDPGGRMYTTAGAGGANILAHWTSSSIIGNWSVSAGNGRAGGSCLRTVAGTVTLDKALPAQQVWGVAYAFRPLSVLSGLLAAFLDGASLQLELRGGLDGSLSVTRNGTAVAATPAGVLVPNTYQHIEFMVKVASAVGGGAYDLWVNGVSKLTATGVNTQATGNASASVVRISNASNTICDFDDVIVYDGQATDAAGNPAMTGPVGDCGLAWLLPTGAGTTTQWTPDSGANWSRVSEATPDTTSYVESPTVGQKDTYALADLPANVTGVKAVAVCHYAEKTDVGSRQMGAVVRSGGADSTHPTGIDLTNGYAYSFRAWDSDPNGGGAWTPAKVNALEVGQVVNS